MEGNEASKRVLEKCGFKCFDGRFRRHMFFKKNGDSDEEDGSEGALTKNIIDELKSAIEGMNIQTRPEIEPVSADTGIDTVQMGGSKLVSYRYYRDVEL